MKRIWKAILLSIIALCLFCGCKSNEDNLRIDALNNVLSFNNNACNLSDEDLGCMIDSFIFQNISYSIDSIKEEYAEVSIECIDFESLLSELLKVDNNKNNNIEYYQNLIIDELSNNNFKVKKNTIKLYFSEENGIVSITNLDDLSKVIIGNLENLDVDKDN